MYFAISRAFTKITFLGGGAREWAKIRVLIFIPKLLGNKGIIKAELILPREKQAHGFDGENRVTLILEFWRSLLA